MDREGALRLTNRKYGLYSWHNDADVRSVQRLSANVFRDPETRARWCVRLFGQGDAQYLVMGVWSLRMARGILARVSAGYAPEEGTAPWVLTAELKRLGEQAWLDACDIEIARI